jgi:hypothetical protein
MPKTPPKPAPRTRRSKAEIQKEFTEIRTEVAAAHNVADRKFEEVAKVRESAVRQAVEGLTVETAVQRISTLSLEIGKALSGLSESLVQEVDRLASLREAAELERRELERLHKIDVAATALDQLCDEYARQEEQLSSKMEAQTSRWEEERKATEQERREQEETLKKQRQREAEEYEYKKLLERKKAQDKYEEEQRVQDKKNKETQENLDKSWKQREAELKEREQELLRLRKEAEAFPAQLQQAITKAAEEAKRATETQMEQQMVLLKKDAESEARLAQQRIQTLEATVSGSAAQLATLQRQLEEAKAQVQDIAVRAIESTSGAKALAHVNQIAMEQAKQRSGPA